MLHHGRGNDLGVLLYVQVSLLILGLGSFGEVYPKTSCGLIRSLTVNFILETLLV